MIFATVGTQLPFPRLMNALNDLASRTSEEIVAQTGEGTTDRTSLREIKSLQPAEFSDLFHRARVVVSHAGIGSILSARRYGKPLIIVPRRHALDEHRNDHQMATARQVEGSPGIYVAWETDMLADLLASDLAPASEAMSPSRERLITHIASLLA
jgi:UDP-N-acetylglucosamine transferase subunit ALG13